MSILVVILKVMLSLIRLEGSVRLPFGEKFADEMEFAAMPNLGAPFVGATIREITAHPPRR
jgi:hypothetical protein